MADLLSIGGALLGGLLGGNNSSTNTTADKAPWAPVQPWLTSNINNGQALQKYYQDNPFSQAQQAAYTNQFKQGADVRSTLPGIFNQMSSNAMFDRSNPTKAVNPLNFGLNSGASAAPGAPSAAPGAVADPSALFSNPFTNGMISGRAPTATPALAAAPAAALRSGGGSQNHALSDAQKAFFDNETPAERDARMQSLGDVLGGVAKFFVPGFSFLSALTGNETPAPSTPGSQMGYANAQADKAAGYAAATQGGEHGGYDSGRFGSDNSSNNVGRGEGGADSAGDHGAGGPGSWKGGLVTANKLSGPNPDTPDDGYGALQKGEYVIKKDAVQKYGKGLLAEINSKRFQKRG